MALPVKLQADEELVTIQKRHPVYVILKGIGAVIVAGLAIWGLSWLSSLGASDGALWTWLYVAIVLIAAGYIGLLIYRFVNDLWIVTNQRLIDSLRTTPFNQQISSTDLINVQDINIRRSGIMATMFNFGDVLCQTASTQGLFTFTGVGKPTELMEMLDRLRDEARKQNQQAIGAAAGQAASAGAAPASQPPQATS